MAGKADGGGKRLVLLLFTALVVAGGFFAYSYYTELIGQGIEPGYNTILTAVVNISGPCQSAPNLNSCFACLKAVSLAQCQQGGCAYDAGKRACLPKTAQ